MCVAGSPAWAELDSAGTTVASTGSLQEVWNKKMEETPQPGKETELSDPDITEEETEKIYNTTPQLSEWDILRMNNGDADFLYSDEGYLTFLRGKFYEDKVADPEEGITALFGIAKLLGLSKGAEFFGVFAEQNRFGYTYITYKQRYGDLTLENAVLKLVIDPEGYTAGLVCSFTPNVGMAGPEESSVTSQEAEQIVLDYYPQYQMTVYPDHTRQTSVTVNDIAYHAWAVFTDYPSEASPPEGRGYLEHLVAYDGSYLMYMAVSSPQELVLGDNAQTELALTWFEGMEADTWTGTVTLHDGTKKNITVPVVCDPKTGTYYLADLQRHILLADYYEYSFEKKYVPWSSQDNTGWPQHYLLTYETYIKVYDFFAEYGLVSVDGFGMPILILTDYCDRAHTPENNACYMGMMNGWAVFAASEVNDYGECIDVAAHEFTHGITVYTIGGDLYENESGAVNEGLSDVLGNLCEMLMGETTDTEWLMAENCGYPIRKMSYPWDYYQPVTVGGRYYQEPADTPLWENDFGGVHTNNSLIGHIAWRLCAEGMTLEDAFCLWKEAINLLTPLSGYREIHRALVFAAKIRQMEEKWVKKIDLICEQAGY